MFMPQSLGLYPRDNDDGLSKQNVIIIAVCSSVAGLILTFILFRIIRHCRRPSQYVPHPPPQPLAHHRERDQHLSQFVGSLPRVTTWYEPQLSATDQFRPSSPGGSKSSLLGKEVFSPSIPPSTETIEEIVHPAEDGSQYLPPPSASFNRPGSRSSLNSSDASCTTLPVSPDTATTLQGSPRPMPPIRRPRPLSMSSISTHHTMMSVRRGVPHASHNQIQIILPAPLASANNSVENLAQLRSRFDSDGGDRRSLADPWISIGPTNNNLKHVTATQETPARRRQASLALSSSRMYPVLYEDQATISPLPSFTPAQSGTPSRKGGTKKLEKRK